MASYKNPIKNALYTVFKGMRDRCNKPSHKDYSSYGGRGIYIAEVWSKFPMFYHWAVLNGYKRGLSIDRIDGNGPYSPSNCRWIPLSLNCHLATINQKYGGAGSHVKLSPDDVRYIHSQSTKSSQQLADELGVNRRTVWNVRSGATWPEMHPDLTPDDFKIGDNCRKRVSWGK